MARPSLRTPGLHLLIALDPACPTLGGLLLAGRPRREDGGHRAVREAHALTAERVIDGIERGTIRVEHLLEDFHQILEQVKAIGDLGSSSRSLPGSIRITAWTTTTLRIPSMTSAGAA